MLLRATYAVVLAVRVISASPTIAPIIDLGYAQYQGQVDTTTNVTTFLGICYLAPPLGELRFRAPTAPENVTGLQSATTQPDKCFQADNGQSQSNPLSTRDIGVGTSEDCLFLSVYYTSDTDGVPVGQLPTIVWIHGGGYVAGSASMYRGTDLIAQSSRGVVVVTIQYRLGVFGFLSGTEVKKNGALNAGLLDQDFALRWVNKHISKFGGDASKVTIWGEPSALSSLFSKERATDSTRPSVTGESAGAGSVLQHVVAHNGKTKPQLFRAAITSSTFLPSQYNYNDRIPELLYGEVVAQTNCSQATDTLICLRAADVNALENANLNISAAAFFGTYVFVPVVDGEFITQRPTISLAEKKVNGEALLSVTNALEGTVFVDQTTAATANATQYSLNLFPDFSVAQADKLGTLYAGLGTPIFQENDVMGESIFICPTYLLLDAFAGRSFKGEYAIPPAFHGVDAEYYFPSLLVDFPEIVIPIFNNTAFIDAFAQSFISFAISLDPNIKLDPRTITPKWSRWSAGKTEMLFNKTDTNLPLVRAVRTSDALLKRCQFWGGVAGSTSQ
ncbi:alpha beta-hydrolase [Mycena polygramma]|nr:alpha beta-hydrolase [Mycena polygramma]